MKTLDPGQSMLKSLSRIWGLFKSRYSSNKLGHPSPFAADDGVTITESLTDVFILLKEPILIPELVPLKSTLLSEMASTLGAENWAPSSKVASLMWRALALAMKVEPSAGKL